MKILAIDSSEVTSSVALTDGKELIAVSTLNSGLTHSENLLPSIENLMKSTGTEWNDIEMYAVSVGPGSFTGIRIGVATVKGLAFGRNIPCVGVSTLEAMAQMFAGIYGIICPVMDARHGQLYNAVFRSDENGITRLTEDRAIDVAELVKELENYGENIYFCGGGYEIAKKAAENPNIKDTPALLRYENGYGVALAALEKYGDGGDFTDTSLAPVYLRPSQAERMKNGENP